MDPHGRIYHNLGALVPPFNLRRSFLSVYNPDTDYVTQSGARTAQMPNLNIVSLTQITAMLDECNLYKQSFSALQNWFTRINAPNLYQTIVHNGHRPAKEHVRQFSGPESSNIAVIIPGVENDIVRTQNIVIFRQT